MLLGSLILFLLSATLGTRVLAGQFTPGFHEYETMFLYGSDIFLILLLFVAFVFSRHPERSEESHEILRPMPQDDKKEKVNGGKFFSLSLVAFLLVAGISIFFATSKLLAFYQFVRLLALIALAFAISRIAREKKVFKIILGIIGTLAIIQSFIGIAQFTRQGAIGLRWLGESPISVTDGASSKILVDGSRVLRVYGLFPHPNILAAFLVLGFFALTHFYLKADEALYGKLFDWKKSVGENFRRFIGSKSLYLRIALALGIFIVLLGLTLTFSRSAWLAADVSLLFLFVSLIFSRRVSIRSLLRLLFLLFAICALLFAMFRPFILPRATLSLQEPSVDLRLRYNDLALKLIREHPLGVGFGNQVLFAVREKEYESLGMTEVWQWQPVHNLYLLMASEIGILGLASFLFFILIIFFIRHSSFAFRVSAAMLLFLLLIAATDHFLWTIWPGQIMLWVVIGLIIAVRARSSTDRMHPSEG